MWLSLLGHGRYVRVFTWTASTYVFHCNLTPFCYFQEQSDLQTGDTSMTSGISVDDLPQERVWVCITPNRRINTTNYIAQRYPSVRLVRWTLTYQGICCLTLT